MWGMVMYTCRPWAIEGLNVSSQARPPAICLGHSNFQANVICTSNCNPHKQEGHSA